MYIYRYRSSGLLTQKELMYDELYFASQAELNDPVDMMAHFEFPSNSTQQWFAFFEHLTKSKHIADIAASYFNSICPITYQDILDSFDFHANKLVLRISENIGTNSISPRQLYELVSNFNKILNLYRPNTGYSVSFSKINDDMLMWSHYAASHTGCCFIFRPVNNALNQCHARFRESIKVTDHFTCGVPKELELKGINYSHEIQSMNAFTLFPSAYTGMEFNGEEERLDFHRKKEKQLKIHAGNMRLK